MDEQDRLRSYALLLLLDHDTYVAEKARLAEAIGALAPSNVAELEVEVDRVFAKGPDELEGKLRGVERLLHQLHVQQLGLRRTKP